MLQRRNLAKQVAPGNPFFEQMRQPKRLVRVVGLPPAAAEQSGLQIAPTPILTSSSLSDYMVVRQELTCDLYDLVY